MARPASLPGLLAAYGRAEYVSVSVLCPETGPGPRQSNGGGVHSPTWSHRHTTVHGSTLQRAQSWVDSEAGH